MQTIYQNNTFKLKNLPLEAIYVIDNWLPENMFTQFDDVLGKTNRWIFDNDVTKIKYLEEGVE